MKKVNSIPALRTMSAFVLTAATSADEKCRMNETMSVTITAKSAAGNLPPSDNNNNNNNNNSPAEYVRSLLPTITRKRNRNIAFRAIVKQEDLDNYDMESVRAVRANDVQTLRTLLKGGKCFQACNRNGETLLHLACRRGNMETVKFLLHEAGVPADVQDDMGRTVLHDVCWRPTPDFALMEVFLEVVSPSLLLQEDVRGHTCLDYCRKHDWGKWVTFLEQHAASIERRAAIFVSLSGAL